MDKKNYVKPGMKVIKLNHRMQLLGGSPGPDPGGYIPGMEKDDMNKLA